MKLFLLILSILFNSFNFFNFLDRSTEHAALRRGLFFIGRVFRIIGAVIDLCTGSVESPGEVDGGKTALDGYPRQEDGDACAEIGDELEVTSLSV